MKKRIIDLRDQVPILDIVSYGRAGQQLSAAQRAQIDRTVRRVPEVMVKVSGGARTLRGVGQHMRYIGREGALGLETDFGEREDGNGFEREVIEDWELGVDSHPRQTGRSIQRGKPPKLVHNLIFSMPPGTAPEKVLKAVRKLALNEWQWKHRYAMALHTDDDHPHVHVVLKAVSEQGQRLNIRKATLRTWRSQFAENLRELGVAANATERAVRGQSKSRKSDGIYRAFLRGESTHVRTRQNQVERELAAGGVRSEPGGERMRRTRAEVLEGWTRVAGNLRAEGRHDLADRIRMFIGGMPPLQTEKERLADELRQRSAARPAGSPQRTR